VIPPANQPPKQDRHHVSANLPHVLAKSTTPRTVQDYNAALQSAGGFLAEIEKAHAHPLSGDPLTKSTFAESNSPTSV